MAKLSQSKKTSKKLKQSKTQRKLKGGKCNCSSSFFTGGNANLSPYPLNTFDNDPRDSIQSTRMMLTIKGGKSKRQRNRSHKRHQRKSMKGGSTPNVIANGFSVSGAVLGGNILAGNTFNGTPTSPTGNTGGNIVV